VAFRRFRYRFYPTPEQEHLLRRTIGCCRLVYNKALSERTEAWVKGKKSLGYAEQARRLTQWKKLPELDFLNDVSCVPLQQTLRHLQIAYAGFFKKKTLYPKFKRKSEGGNASFTTSGGFWFIDGKLTLAKMREPLDIRWSRPIPEGAKPSIVTASLDAADRWHVSILCEDKSIKPLPKLKTAVGIDLGVLTLATLSTGEKIPNPNFEKILLPRQRKLARRFSRKQKGSKNYDKARIKLARLKARIADQRRDYLHQVSTKIVRENQVIVVEDLSVENLRRNKTLSRSISDVGWGMFLRNLEYKSRWYGRTFVKVDRFFPSSKTCSSCGFVLDKIPLSVRNWACPTCGEKHDRDVNAARNLLAAGLAVTICGPDVSQRILRDTLQSGVKQKNSSVKKGTPSPTEESQEMLLDTVRSVP
jgi:putative transposase